MKLLSLFLVLGLIGCSTSVPVKRNFPEIPSELMQKCPELKQTEVTTKMSDVLRVVTENYSQYHECNIKAQTWIEWYKAQKEIFESAQ
jgi:hypothetical protein